MGKRSRYTVTAIAKELGVTRQTIYYWMKKNWVIPKRDYRDYPIFSANDLRRIIKWHGALRIKESQVKQKGGDKPATSAVPASHPMTWEEIQKTLYK